MVKQICISLMMIVLFTSISACSKQEVKVEQTSSQTNEEATEKENNGEKE